MGLYDRTQQFEEEALSEAKRRISTAEEESFNPGADEWSSFVSRQASQEQRQRNQLARSEPYFARIDFGSTTREAQRYYISKYVTFRTQHGYLVDWRSPLATLHYRGARGQSSYLAPGGIIQGEVNLRRKLTITEGNLRSHLDEYDALSPEARQQDANSADLQQRLKQRSKGTMQEIVATIQREQYEAITVPLIPGIIVEGPAGSGKTAVTLHRVAYLLHPDVNLVSTLSAKSTLILGPNKLFMTFVQEVLPSLVINGVTQTTFERFWWFLALKPIEEQEGKNPHKNAGKKAERNKFVAQAAFNEWCERWVNAQTPPEIIAYLKLALRAKQSLRMIHLIQAYRDFLLKSFCFDNNFVMHIRQKDGNIVTHSFSGSAMYIVAQEALQQQSLPLNRMREIALATLSQWTREQLLIIEKECINTIGRLDVEGNRNSIDKQIHSYLEVCCSWPIYISCFGLDHSTWEKLKYQRPQNDKTTYGHLCRLLSQKEMLATIGREFLTPAEIDALLMLSDSTMALEREDLPLLAYFEHIFINPLASRFQHIVIDEGQDFSPIHYFVLGLLSVNGAFTVLGDLNQHVFPERGIASWDEGTDALALAHKGNGAAPAPLQCYTLDMSYRSTCEILTFAKSILGEQTDHTLAQTMRSGPEPRLHEYDNEDELYRTLLSILKQGIQYTEAQTIGVLTISNTVAHSLAERLRRRCATDGLAAQSIWELRDLAQRSEVASLRTLPKGVLCGAIWQAKGLEFDTVVIPFADATTFQDTKEDRGLLYVAATRAMHELFVFWQGRPSSWLKPYLQQHQPTSLER